MVTKVLLFGRLVEIVKSNSLYIKDVKDTDTLLQKLHNDFPELASTAYCIAVNKNVVNDNTEIDNETEVALLPQFAGG